MEMSIRNIFGIAADETKRILKERDGHKLLPLVKWRNDRKRMLRILLSTWI